MGLEHVDPEYSRITVLIQSIGRVARGYDERDQIYTFNDQGRKKTNDEPDQTLYPPSKKEIQKKIWTISRFVRVILAQGPC